ncbi:hypothetical protein N7507_002123 [Penicillium longicatenatum]|nr:hypothetical protein N7507_002123 [Penicillium longicatenatum]
MLKSVTNDCDGDDDFQRAKPDRQRTGTDEQGKESIQGPSRSGAAFQKSTRQSTGQNRSMNLRHNGKIKAPFSFLRFWAGLEENLNFIPLAQARSQG